MSKIDPLPFIALFMSIGGVLCIFGAIFSHFTEMIVGFFIYFMGLLTAFSARNKIIENNK